MDGGNLYESSNITLVLQNQNLTCSSLPSLQGSKSLVNVVNVNGIGIIDRPVFQDFEKEKKDGDGDDDEDYEVCLNQTGKKRRLTSEQVQSLESNFEVENKLGPKRKVQLAKELGLEPRQVAIWFQNRRARFKTKQLEKDYTTLKGSYDVLKVDFDNLLQENDKLKQEVNSLKNRMVPKEKEEHNLVDKAYDGVYPQHKVHMDLILKNTVPENDSKMQLPGMVISKQEDANSAKSDVVDSESPHNTDGNQSSFIDHSDFSQDEEDILSQNLLTLPFLPKFEDVCYDEPPECSCSFQFPFEDQTFGFWSY